MIPLEACCGANCSGTRRATVHCTQPYIVHNRTLYVRRLCLLYVRTTDTRLSVQISREIIVINIF